MPTTYGPGRPCSWLGCAGEVLRGRAGGEACEGVGRAGGHEGGCCLCKCAPLIVLRLYSPGLDGTDLEILIREQSPRLPSVTQLELLGAPLFPNDS